MPLLSTFRGLIADFFLLWSIGLDVLKWALKGYISHETAGLLYAGAAVILAVVAQVGSEFFRKRLNMAKFVASLLLFAFSCADGDIDRAVVAGTITLLLTVGWFAFYVWVRRMWHVLTG